jgi:hypothetical protein
MEWWNDGIHDMAIGRNGGIVENGIWILTTNLALLIFD